jgi:hypothetical protein
LLIYFQSFSQRTSGLDKFEIDTLYLKQDFSATKIVAFQMDSLTIFMDHKFAKANLKKRWKYNGKRYYGKKYKRYERKSPYVRPFVIDSLYRTMNKSIKKQDTVYISNQLFIEIGVRPLFDLNEILETGDCAIVNINNQRCYTIIKITGGWWKGPKHSWDGRMYHLPNHWKWFFAVTDRIS